ncbi:MAG: AAA family ATPase [Pseudomonadota bacterium]
MVPPGSRFCPSCGAKLALRCKSCGAEVGEGDRFCRECGAPQEPPPGSDASDGEHRLLTIMFSDLVGSTNLAMMLDPEELREVLRRYQAACTAAIEGHDGMISAYLGDGILAFFGYPVALEDAAIRAADAARQIVSEAERIDREISARIAGRVRVRVALHSGMVLVGQMGSGELKDRHSVVGALPNVTARLQELAPTNGVVISEEVRRRLNDAFAVTPLGAHSLKGVTGEIEVYELGQRNWGPEASGPEDEIELFGRERELGILRRAWESYARDGLGGIVTVVGEPGVGKSGLLRRFLQDLDTSTGGPLVFTGAISDRETVFSSLWRMLERECVPSGAERDDSDAALLAWFAEHGCESANFREALLALRRSALTSLETLAGTSDLRADIFAAFRRYLAQRPRPLLIVLEDAHWIDPSTLEMIDGALEESDEPDHLLVVMTRTGRRYPWSRRVTMDLELSGLTEAACRGIIQRVAGGVPPDREVGAQIASLANGLPLHVEEMARMMIERGLVGEQSGRLRFRGIGAEIPIPGNLLDLLMARLDSLGEEKALAQAAAVLGPVVTATALEAVTMRGADYVSAGLRRLREAMVVEPDQLGETFHFRHALFQKAAYETLLKSRRAQLHSAYVDWLQSPQSDQRVAPETLGYHCFGAQRFADAAAHFRDAGMLAAKTGGNREAAVYFSRALEASRAAAPSAGDTPETLELQVRLAGALLGADGPGAESTSQAYETAVEICDRVPESHWHFPAYWGWWRISSNFPEMTRRAARIVAVADRMQDQEFKLQSHHCMWANTFQIGAHAQTLHHARQGLALYRPEISAEQSILFGGHDCKVCGHGQIALTRWLTGEGEAARQDIALAMRHGEALGHDGSLLHALDISATLHCYMRDASGLAEAAARLLSLGEVANVDEYIAKGQFYQGWVLCSEKDAEAGLARMDEAYGMLEAVATNEDFPLFLSLRASAMRRLGNLDGAVQAITAAREIVASEGVTYWAAEIERQAAENAMAFSQPDEDKVAALLAEGKRIARDQGAVGLELRNAQATASWYRKLGDRARALGALGTALERIGPDATGHDIDDARRMQNAILRDV